MNYLEIYNQANKNAIDLLEEASILYTNKKYARAYFLAYTALEEISKSQHAADVVTGLKKPEDFEKFYLDHKKKINGMQWAHTDANSFRYNEIWLGPNIDDVEKIAPAKPLWEKRQNSLYVGINNGKTINPENSISEQDAKEVIHIVGVALQRIWEMTEEWGHQIGTKGFMK